MGVKGVNFINKQRAKVMKGLLQSSYTHLGTLLHVTNYFFLLLT